MGLFILFEGVEGSGKSTQTRALKKHLINLGLPVTLVKEPGSTEAGKVISQLLKHSVDITITPLTELLLFAASRSQLVSEVIRPALAQNGIVICDRYTESTLAYQGYGRGLDPQTIYTVNSIATDGLRPDIILLLDLNVEKGFQRKHAPVENDRFEQEEILFHQRVRQGYLKMAGENPDSWLVINADQQMQAIQQNIRDQIHPVLLQKGFS